MVETGLSEMRLIGELNRTVVQLLMFADVVVDGSYLDVRIDERDEGFVLGLRPDLRRCLVPVGPVLNFAASNFPFAFSVAGGDTASALAAGCPVIVKGHSGHPMLSQQTADVVIEALSAASAPPGTFQLISGQAEGVALLLHPCIRAGSFTGSIPVGRMLADLAASRPRPIPFFGELGSVNPAFVTARAAAESASAIARGYVDSVAGSAGQLCTKPGFLFVPADGDHKKAIREYAGAATEHRLLNPGITEKYGRRREAILKTPGVLPIVEGSLTIDEEAHGWATPTIVATSVETLRLHRDRLLDEAFGPLSIVVEYEDEKLLADVAEEFFLGNLTGTVHAAEGEDTPHLRALLDWTAQSAGRIVFGGWPTGVAVTPAMQHGGPWPATSNDTGTSVGTAAISRFMRAVTYQDVPQTLLPEPVRDDNPWNVPQTRSEAGDSATWGSASR